MYIYLITCKISNKNYIGQTLFTIDKRWRSHISQANNKNTRKYPLHYAILKYGESNFRIRQLAHITGIDATSWLNILETLYIKTYNSLVPFGYNLETGGNNGRLHESTRLKMSLAHLNKPPIPRTPEWNAKIGILHKGRKHTEQAKANMSTAQQLIKTWTGRKHSQETKDKLKKINAGKKYAPRSFEQRQQQSIRSSGRKHTDETKLKMSISRLGNTNMLGKKRSAETKAKISASLKKYFSE